jgi:16S rRNA (cytosine1402-N4)-methyltransferase
MPNLEFYHESVLLNECIENLNIQPNGIYVDATFGGGGHSKAILSKLGPKGRLIAFDQDKDAQRNLPDDDRVLFIPENFKYIQKFLRLHNIPGVNGVLADLGVSSYQFDKPERGFSIRFNALLDMRMDVRTKQSAKDIINSYTEKQLHKIFEQYGEVTNARTLAQTIVQKRTAMKINTIEDFKQLINSCIKGMAHKYLAQVFQALRIEVNKELEVLEDFCKQAIEVLAPKGRLCIISFHSLEDRIVKQCMQERIKEDSQHYHHQFVQAVVAKQLTIISSKPITASQEELKYNTRSRSAKLRVAEKK